MDAAERLFAAHGFDGVSVRAITEAAQVDVALISYHFGGKRELFASLFQRRAEHLNAQRTLALDAVIAAAHPNVPSIDAVLDSFVQPMRRLAAEDDPGWRYFFQIAAQVNNSPHWAPLLMGRHFDPSAERLIALVREALPDTPPAQIFWGILFLTGALTITFAQTGRVDRLSGGLCQSTDLHTALSHLVPFITAGFRGMPTESKSVVVSKTKAARKTTIGTDVGQVKRKAANVVKKSP